MRSKIIRGLLLLLALAVAAGILWLNQDRWFGRIVLPEENLAFGEQIKQIRAEREWNDAADYRPALTRETLLASLRLGCDFIVINQKEEGNFNYEYDFVAKEQSPGDNQVRQAGALWGVALCQQFAPAEKTRAALEKGLDFFFTYTVEGPENSLTIFYPGEKAVALGTVALTALAIIDYLRAEQGPAPDRRRELESKLDGYLKFIAYMQFKGGDFSFGLTRGVPTKIGRSSSYFDGESQLALARAIKYLDKPGYEKEYLPVLQKAVMKTSKKYTVDAWRKKRDSDDTKGFYQWGSMAFYEYWDAGWENAEFYGDTVIALAWWMIHTHKTLLRSRNTGYAYEGLAHAYQLAKRQGDETARRDIARVIDKGLAKLISWQVEGPLLQENSYLKKHRTDDPLAVGGVMNHRKKAPLRIDVTQHQMHALILALKYVYLE